MKPISRTSLFFAGLGLALSCTLATTAAVAAVREDASATALSDLSSQVLARRGRGADDGTGETRGRGRGADDGAGHTALPQVDGLQFARRGRGADDGAGHDVGDDKGQRGKNGGKGRGRGADDGAGHA